MNIVKSGFPKDGVWALMVVLAFGLGLMMNRGESPPPMSSPAPSSQHSRDVVTALPKSRLQPEPHLTRVSSDALPISADPISRELRRRVDGMDFVGKLVELAKADPSTAPDAAHYIADHFDLREIPDPVLSSVFKQFRSIDFQGAIAWLESLPVEASDRASSGMVGSMCEWAKRDRVAAKEWLGRQKGSPNYDMLATAFAVHTLEIDGDLAYEVASTIASTTQRDRVERLVEHGRVYNVQWSDKKIDFNLPKSVLPAE